MRLTYQSHTFAPNFTYWLKIKKNFQQVLGRISSKQWKETKANATIISYTIDVMLALCFFKWLLFVFKSMDLTSLLHSLKGKLGALLISLVHEEFRTSSLKYSTELGEQKYHMIDHARWKNHSTSRICSRPRIIATTLGTSGGDPMKKSS